MALLFRAWYRRAEDIDAPFCREGARTGAGGAAAAAVRLVGGALRLPFCAACVAGCGGGFVAGGELLPAVVCGLGCVSIGSGRE